MIVGNNHAVSCYGKGRNGWQAFLAAKESDFRYNDYKQFNADYATGVYLDVTTGLFAFETADQMKPFVKDDGTYGTGVCRDYNGNWMLRRSLWTDANGVEHVAEGTATDDGQLLDPIVIREHVYEPDTVYPLTDSWADVWHDISIDDGRNQRYVPFSERHLFNLVVPLSFFKYLQHHYQMYAFGELSSRTFLTEIRPLADSMFLLSMIVDYYLYYEDYPYDIEDSPMFANAIISFEGKIIDPLQLEIPDNTTNQCYWDAYRNYLEKTAAMPKT